MLSIIIPTHNEEHYLPKLLKCIKEQDYKDYEIIIGDSFSTDKTIEIARRYGCRIVKDMVPNGGPARGRNNGAKAAKGDMLLFMDADVRISDDFLHKAAAELKERKIDAAGCYLVPDSGNIFDKFNHFVLNSWFGVMQYIWPHMVGQCIFSKKKIHRKLNGFDETILFAEDMDYVNRSRKFGKFRMLNSVKIISSTRRFKHENAYLLGLKYLLCPLYRILFGEIRTNIFNYKMRMPYRKL